MQKHNNMGSVSNGTMRTEDLIPSLLSELESQRPLKRAHRKLLKGIESNIHNVAEGVAEFYFESEESQEDLDSLFDALNEYAAPYFYFGAHPGDGSDYGYWLSESWDEDFCRDANCKHQDCSSIIVNDSSAIPTGFTGEAAVVNDHGNVTLYRVVRGHKYEVWSIV